MCAVASLMYLHSFILSAYVQEQDLRRQEKTEEKTLTLTNREEETEAEPCAPAATLARRRRLCAPQ